MSDLLQLIETAAPAFPATVACVLGLIVGSFLNVCILRIPAGRSLVTPGSTCQCGKPIRWHDNIPVLSWLLLRGRARCCGAPFSIRYPMIEALTGLLFLGAWLAYGSISWQLAAGIMAFLSILVAATFIDLDHMIIPDRFSIGGAAGGILLAAFVPQLHAAPADALLGGALHSGMTAVQGLLVGSGITLWILILAEAVLRKEAMGFGDVKLMGAIGAVCGWQGSLFALFGGSLLGTLYLVGALIWEKLRPGPGKTTPASPEESEAGEENRIGFGKQLPFGPMLASGAALYLLLLKPWFDAYLAQIVPLFRP